MNANCKPHLLYESEVIAWNNSGIIVFAFNSAMCRIYNVSIKLLPTVCHYTGQTDICNDIVHRRHQFLSKRKMNSNNVIRYNVNRLIDRILQSSICGFYVVFLLYCVCVSWLVFILSISFCVTICLVNERCVSLQTYYISGIV